MSNRRILYWFFQTIGWGGILGLDLYIGYLEDEITSTDFCHFFLFLMFAISATHIYRMVINGYNWKKQSIGIISLYAFFASIFLAFILLGANFIISYAYENNFSIQLEEIIRGFITLIIYNIIWSLFYFSYHFVDKSRKQEVKNLQLQSTQKESELTNLKNQLNPHFMFNAMNSIRALIDEDPVLAKKSVTQLSNLLRNTLKLGQQKLITIEDELKIVTDYLTLEKVRFEERLEFNMDVEDGLLDAKVPPLVIQTVAENAVKHGIGKLAKGGEINIHIFTKSENICIKVTNDGNYQPESNLRTDSNTGIGLKNTSKRLRILFGHKGNINIRNENNLVVSEIHIPKTPLNLNR